MGSCVPFSHGFPWPICLPWASSTLLLTLYSHGFLLTLLGFLAQLLHTLPWGLWVCHQSPTFFACIALGLPQPILTFFTSHTTHGFATHYFSLSGLFWAHLLSQGPFTYFMDLWSIIPVAWTKWFFLFCVSCQLLCVVELSFLSYIWVSQKKDPQQKCYMNRNPWTLQRAIIVKNWFNPIVKYSRKWAIMI